MSQVVQRMLDGGGPFALWPPGGCAHGVHVEMLLDPLDDGDDVTLVLRASERQSYDTLRADVVRLTTRFSLSTRQWHPQDEASSRFLAEHPWIEHAIDDDRIRWLRERRRRAAAQRDRSLPLQWLDQFEPGSMVAYDRLFPADWDLLVAREERSYWAVDQHCLNPACSCASIVVVFYVAGKASSGSIGQARLDFGQPRRDPSASSPLAKDLFLRLWRRDAAELRRRFDEVRAAVLSAPAAQSHPSASGLASVAPPARQPSRNLSCPCGSGKKYKRCCGDPRVSPP